MLESPAILVTVGSFGMAASLARGRPCTFSHWARPALKSEAIADHMAHLSISRPPHSSGLGKVDSWPPFGHLPLQPLPLLAWVGLLTMESGCRYPRWDENLAPFKSTPFPCLFGIYKEAGVRAGEEWLCSLLS